jgi:anti-sigma B factor antagonist
VPLSLVTRHAGDIVVLVLTGRLVEGAESAALQQTLSGLLPDHPYLVLDVCQVDFVDSSGLGLLVRFLSRARAAGGDVKLCAVPPRMAEVLRITKLQAVFEQHPSEAAAIAAFYDRSGPAATADRLASDVLCVESSPDVLAYACEVMRQAGYAVMPSGNLPDAVVLLKGLRPRALVVGSNLRASAGTTSAEAFAALAGSLPVVELPPEFSATEAGEAGQRLLDGVRAILGEPEAAAIRRGRLSRPV